MSLRIVQPLIVQPDCADVHTQTPCDLYITVSD